MGKYDKHNAAKDEGHAEPLSHVEGHAFLKIDLLFFDELDEETHTEKGDEPPTKEAAVVKLAVLFAINNVANNKDDEIAESLIELRGMLRHSLAVALKDEAPRQRGLDTVDFGVEEVAQTDEGTTQGHHDNKTVKKPPEVHLVFAAIDPKREENCDGGAMACETLIASELARLEIKWEEYLGPMLGCAEIARLIEETVSEACAYEDSDKHPQHQGIEIAGSDLLAGEHLIKDVIAQQESKEESQRIVSQPEIADMEHYGIDIPIDEIEQHNVYSL